MKGGGRHDHQPPISIGAVTALALATSAAPASARSFDFNPNGSYVPVTAASTRAHSQATTPSRTVSTSPTIVRVSAGNSGFDWVDAGIGAAGGLAISIVGLGGALATSQHRAPRPPNRSRNQLTNTERHAGQHHVETEGAPGATAKLQSAIEIGLLAVGALVAVGVAVLFVALTRANRTRPVSTGATPASAASSASDYRCFRWVAVWSSRSAHMTGPAAATN